MKKILKKLGCNALVVIVVFGIVLSVADLHTDGILVRDGNYYIRPSDNVAYQVNVLGGLQIPGTLVQSLRVVDGANQMFAIKHVQDDEYAIMYGTNGLCIAVASDKETVVVQDYDEKNDYNRWHITRIGESQSFLFTNVATDTSLYYEYSSELKINQMKVKEYDGSDKTFEYTVVKFE